MTQDNTNTATPGPLFFGVPRKQTPTTKSDTSCKVRKDQQLMSARDRSSDLRRIIMNAAAWLMINKRLGNVFFCFLFFFFLEKSSAIGAERARSLVRGSRLLSHHVRYAIALGKLKTPAPTMAVTLWKAEYHHLAFLELVTGNHSSTFLLLGTERSCRRNSKQFFNVNCSKEKQQLRYSSL